MNFEHDLVSILEAESEKPRDHWEKTEGLSAWSENSAGEATRKNSLIPGCNKQESHKQRAKKKFSRLKEIQMKRSKPVSVTYQEKNSKQIFDKPTKSFASYIKSFITQNSNFGKNQSPYNLIDKSKKLEVISIKLFTSPTKRLNSISPEKLNKAKTPRLFEDSFLIHQKLPPAVAGCSITFYEKSGKLKSKNSTFSPFNEIKL